MRVDRIDSTVIEADALPDRRGFRPAREKALAGKGKKLAAPEPRSARWRGSFWLRAVETHRRALSRFLRPPRPVDRVPSAPGRKPGSRGRRLVSKSSLLG